jgi:hypothetical protein
MTSVYKVEIEMALTGGIEWALANVSGLLGSLEKKIFSIDRGFKGWGITLAAVAGAAGLGLVAEGLKEIFEATKDLSHEFNLLEKMGLTPDQMNAAKNAAKEITANVKGVTEKQALEVYGGNVSVLRPEEALATLPDFVKFATALGNLLHDPDAAIKAIQNLTRAGEILGYVKADPKTGQIDEGKLKSFLDMGLKIAEATHGQIGPNELLLLAKQGAGAARGFSMEGLISSAIIAQHLGPQRAGTALQSLYQQFAGGQMLARNADSLQRHGILDPGDYTEGKGGHTKLTDQGSAHLARMIGDDPLKFVSEYLSKLKEHGITDMPDIQRAIAQDFGRSTVQRMISDIVANLPNMLLERGQLHKSLGVDEALGVQNTQDIEQGINNVAAAMTNLKTAIGQGQSENITSALNIIATDIQLLANASNALGKNDMSAFYKSISDLLGVDTRSVKQVTDAIREITSVLNWFSTGGGGAGAKLHDWMQEHSPIPKYDPSQEKGPPSSPDNNSWMWRPQSFVAPPANNSKPIVTTATLNIEGRQIAATIAEHLAEFMEFPNQAPYGDDSSTYHGPAGSTTDT